MLSQDLTSCHEFINGLYGLTVSEIKAELNLDEK